MCSPGALEPPDDYRQLAITGIMMGDTNTVTVLELAHKRQLINANVLTAESLLLPERPPPEGPESGDVHVDDLVLFSILHMSRLHELRDCPRAKRAEQMYRQLALPTGSGKSETGFKAEFWGGALDGIFGSLGFPMQRRTTLMYVTILGALLGVTRGSLQQVLGAWIFALSFRREAHCCSDVAFMCARKLPTRNPVPACGALLDDLLLVTGIAPLLQTNLRAQPRHELFATDASPSAAGACIAKVTPELWRSLHRICEERGEHVRLDWGPAPPLPAFVSAHSSAAALITPVDWTRFFACRFRKGDHTNCQSSLLWSHHFADSPVKVLDVSVFSVAWIRGSSWVWWHKADPRPGSSTTSWASSHTSASPPRSPSTCCGFRRAPTRRTGLRGTSLWTARAETSRRDSAAPLVSCTSPPPSLVNSSSFRNRSLLTQPRYSARVSLHRQRPPAGHSEDRWRLRQLLDAGDVEPHPGPTRSWLVFSQAAPLPCSSSSTSLQYLTFPKKFLHLGRHILR